MLSTVVKKTHFDENSILVLYLSAIIVVKAGAGKAAVKNNIANGRFWFAFIPRTLNITTITRGSKTILIIVNL